MCAVSPVHTKSQARRLKGRGGICCGKKKWGLQDPRPLRIGALIITYTILVVPYYNCSTPKTRQGRKQRLGGRRKLNAVFWTVDSQTAESPAAAERCIAITQWTPAAGSRRPLRL